MRLGDLGARVGGPYEGGADRHPQPAVRVDVGGTDQDRRVQRLRAARVAPDEGQRPRVVAAPARLVAFDHPAGVLHRRADDGRGEHRLLQHLPHIERGAAAQLVLRVREVRHLLEARPDHHTAHVADGAHHLQFLVHDHGQFLHLLAVAQELQQVLRARAPGRVAVGAADRVHHDRPAGHPYVHLGAGADQRAHARPVHDVRPVRAALTGQQPPEQGQRVGRAEARDVALEGAPDDEVGALAGPDLVPQDALDDAGVRVVGDVEGAVRHPHRVGGQFRQHLGQRQLVRLVRAQHRQGRAVVADVEPALADLPERHERERVGDRGAAVRHPFAERDAGQPRHLGHLADQHLDGVGGGAAGRTAVQQGERRAAGGRQTSQDVGGAGVGGAGGGARHVGGSFRVGGTARTTRKAAPRGGLRDVSGYARSVGRRMSGPPPVHVHGRLRVHGRHPTRPAPGAPRERRTARC